MKKILVTISLLLFSYITYAQSVENTPFTIGVVNKIVSKQLSETRTLNIYLPEGYNATDTTRYPVIYLLDGSANEDFVHIAGLVQFFNMMWMMPKTIVVGIANVDRRRDFTFQPTDKNFKFPEEVEKRKAEFANAGKSAKFISFLEEELQPFIEKNYKTSSSKTLIGQSLGGLVATEILFKKPGLFNNYIIVSPSLWWDEESLLKSKPVFNKAFQNTNIFLAVGKEGEMMEADAKKLSEIINASRNFKTFFHYMPDEDHATILHHAVYDAFKAMFMVH